MPENIHFILIDRPGAFRMVESDAQTNLPPTLKDMIERKQMSSISMEDVERFRNSLQRKGAKEDLINKIISNIRYIDRRILEESISLLANCLRSYTDAEDLIFVYNQPAKSGEWITNQFMRIPPLRRARAITLKDLKAQASDFSLTTTFVIADDASYSGEQCKESLRQLHSIFPQLPQEKLILALVGLTKEAQTKLFQDGIPAIIIYRYIFPTCQEIFTAEELSDIFFITGNITSAGLASSVMTFFEHKVPDNFLKLLRDGDGVEKDAQDPVLIHTRLFEPPYKLDFYFNENLRRALELVQKSKGTAVDFELINYDPEILAKVLGKFFINIDSLLDCRYRVSLGNFLTLEGKFSEKEAEFNITQNVFEFLINPRKHTFGQGATFAFRLPDGQIATTNLSGEKGHNSFSLIIRTYHHISDPIACIGVKHAANSFLIAASQIISGYPDRQKGRLTLMIEGIKSDIYNRD
jgi:hypothetical protein